MDISDSCIKTEPVGESDIKTEPLDYEFSSEFIALNPVSVDSFVNEDTFLQETFKEEILETIDISNDNNTPRTKQLHQTKRSYQKHQPKQISLLKKSYSVQVGNTQVPLQCNDLSIFWKPFQEQHAKHRGKVLLTNLEFGKYFLSKVCNGSEALCLPLSWNIFYVKEPADTKLLLSEMGVENDTPVMKRQVIINTSLEATTFYGSRQVKIFDICRIKIQSSSSIKELVATFCQWIWCEGLSSRFNVAKFAKDISFDHVSKRHRHVKCEYFHKKPYDQCTNCKLLEVRNIKHRKLEKQKYMTAAMLMNFKYWRKVQLKVQNLQLCNRKLRKEKCKLVRDKKRLKGKVKKLQQEVVEKSIGPVETIIKFEDDNMIDIKEEGVRFYNQCINLNHFMHNYCKMPF